MSSIIAQARPTLPLFTMHMVPEKYDVAKKIVESIQKRGLPLAQFDREKHVIHFYCDAENIAMIFKSSGQAEYFSERINFDEITIPKKIQESGI